MSRPNKDRIPTTSTGGGLGNAFAGVQLNNLPAGPSVEDSTTAPHSKPQAKPAKLGRVVLRRETAHRGGKCVVVVDGFDPALNDPYIEDLSKKLRAACGCGGTVKDRTIEIQGDQASRIRALLVEQGFRVAGV